jgi:hypothetical protein
MFVIDDIDRERVDAHKWYVMKSTGYVVRTTDDMLLSRFIMSAPKGMVVDHRDGDPLNNRRSNLRVCTHAVNMQNRKGANKNNARSLRNVYYDKRDRRYYVRVIANGKSFNGGRHDTVEEAANAAQQLRAEVLA